MSFVFYCIFGFLGIIIGTLGLIRIIIVLNFGLPFTKKMNKMGLLTDKSAVNKREMMTLGLWSVIIALSVTLIYLFAAHSLIAFMFGAGLGLLFGLGRTGENDANIQDYMSSNHNFIDIDKLKSIDEQILKYESLD